MSGNPTLDAANASTGQEPLNSGPSEPQAPKQQPTGYELPPSLTSSLPSGFTPIAFPLDLGSREKNNQTVSSLPSANAFEDLVRAHARPEGPARAEEIDVEAWTAEYGKAGKEVVAAVKGSVEDGKIKVYRVETGTKGKGKDYVVGLDLDGEKVVGVKVERACGM